MGDCRKKKYWHNCVLHECCKTVRRWQGRDVFCLSREVSA